MMGARKALVIFVIEKVLLEVSKPTYDKVLDKLYRDYHCYISDCYENPEYLSRVLKELYGQSHLAIIQSIEKQLDDMSTQEGIHNFLMQIST
jgi:hypothetical protein